MITLSRVDIVSEQSFDAIQSKLNALIKPYVRPIIIVRPNFDERFYGEVDGGTFTISRIGNNRYIKLEGMLLDEGEYRRLIIKGGVPTIVFLESVLLGCVLLVMGVVGVPTILDGVVWVSLFLPMLFIVISVRAYLEIDEAKDTFQKWIG